MYLYKYSECYECDTKTQLRVKIPSGNPVLPLDSEEQPFFRSVSDVAQYDKCMELHPIYELCYVFF